MDFGLIDLLLTWIDRYPAWAGVVVMLIAFFESLALVGLFLPGAILMFGIGALVGSGALPLWSTLVWAAIGAIAGDGVSFWLGRHFHQRIRVMWPMRTHPELLAQAIDFFHRHGGKSVLLGRFVGPIRPVIPVVAGMLDMPTNRFLVANVISGLLWAPVYVLPGMVFAASLGIAAEVATRLALLLGMLLTLLILVLWLTRRAFNLYHRHAHRLLRHGLAWAERHPRLGHLPAALLDPEHPEARGLTLLGLLLLLSGATLMWGLQGLSGTALPNLDQMLAQALHALRTPWADSLFVAINALGSLPVLGLLFIAVLAWLLWRRHWQAASHWLAAALFAALFSAALHLLFTPITDDGPRPIVYGAALYGFLAVLLGRNVRERWRWLAYASAALLLFFIGFARLYLGNQTLSEVLVGLSLGMLWAALLGIAYLRHPSEHPAARPLLGIALLSLLVAGLWYRVAWFEQDMQHHTPGRAVTTLTTERWWTQAGALLPQERADTRGQRSHPLTLQYAGKLEPLQQALQQQGWHAPVGLDALSWMQWLSSTARVEQLPVLPQVHDGRHQDLLLIKPLPEDGRVLALRLWSIDTLLQPGDAPLWLGNVSYLEAVRVLGTLTVPRTQNDFSAPLVALRRDLSGQEWSMEERTGTNTHTLLLVAPRAQE